MASFTSAADAWLPLDPRHAALAVDRQTNDPDSVLAFTKTMIALRRESAALREGEIVMHDAPEPVLAFERGARMLCLFNLGPDPALRPIPAGGQVRLTLGSAVQQAGAVTLGGFSALLVEF
jgi:alpha-glucosidase